jgi:hypothetical protein
VVPQSKQTRKGGVTRFYSKLCVSGLGRGR